MPIVVIGHLSAGEDKTVDGYLIDFGYDPAEPQSGQKTVFAINLVNETTLEAIETDKLWIRISSTKDSVFAGNLKPDYGNAAFTFAFPSAGKYEFALKFFKDENLLAETNFEVEAKENINFNYIYAAVLAALAILFFAYRKKLFRPKK